MLRLAFLFLVNLAGVPLLAEDPPAQPHPEPVELVAGPHKPEPERLPAQPLTSAEHLRAAVAHLRQAGLHADADRIQRQAEELLERRLAQLLDKRKQLEQLQCEIAELEQELKVASAYELRCLMAEVSLAQLRELGIEIQWPSGTLQAAELFQSARQNLPSPAFETLVEALIRANAVKITARPTLVVLPGQPGVIHSGGEFPVIEPASGSDAKINWRKFGVNFEATVNPLGGDRVRLRAAPEVSERDFANAVAINGRPVPGVVSKSANFTAEMSLGETVLICLPARAGNAGESVFFVAVTPKAITGPAPISPVSRLLPIPDASMTR